MPKAAVAKKPEKKNTPPPVTVAAKAPVLVVDVDWAEMEVGLAREFYAKLKMHFERAGAFLNARTTSSNAQWVCYMADKSATKDPRTNRPGPSDCPTKGQVLTSLPKFIDNAHTNPKTGLVEVVRICSELCSIRYNGLMIDDRRERLAPKRGE